MVDVYPVKISCNAMVEETAEFAISEVIAERQLKRAENHGRLRKKGKRKQIIRI